MRNPKYSTVDPQTGNVTYNGPLEQMKGNHNHMPSRTDAYRSGDIRFHVNASSLGGVNNRTNVVPGHNDVDKGAWASVEKGERSALQNGAFIDSEKTAIVDSQPGDRPTTFLVTDTLAYDNHTENIHSSFTNEGYAVQAEWNDMSAILPGTFDAPNPGDSLRESMGTAYADLMTETDATLPNLDADYEFADFSGVPDSVADVNDISSADAVGDVSSASDTAAADTDGGADAGAGADPD